MHLLLHDRDPDIYRYNKCTNTQLPNFNAGRPLSTGLTDAFELQILPNGDVLVADSNSGHPARPQRQRDSDLLVLRPCPAAPTSSSPSPSILSGTSFWTGDAASGDIWQINIATGHVLQTIDTHSAYLFGLSVDDEIEVAAPPPGDDHRAVDADRPARDRELLDADAGLGRA